MMTLNKYINYLACKTMQTILSKKKTCLQFCPSRPQEKRKRRDWDCAPKVIFHLCFPVLTYGREEEDEEAWDN